MAYKTHKELLRKVLYEFEEEEKEYEDNEDDSDCCGHPAHASDSITA
jgi:hypothetical protein